MSKRTTSQSLQGKAGPNKLASKKINASSSGHFAQIAGVKHLLVEVFTSLLSTFHLYEIQNELIGFPFNVTHVHLSTYLFTFNRIKNLALWAIGGEALYANVLN